MINILNYHAFIQIIMQILHVWARDEWDLYNPKCQIRDGIQDESLDDILQSLEKQPWMLYL